MQEGSQGKGANASGDALAAGRARTWSAVRRGNIVEVGYGSGIDFPQYAALHTDSGFLRLNAGRGSGWGTSVVLHPSFWEAGHYHQGAPISTVWRHDGTSFSIAYSGSISGLRTHGEIRLTPPAPDRLCCTVSVAVEGAVKLDRRPGEAFKPVVLSSMHVSAEQWDALAVRVGSQSFQIPEAGWIIQPVAIGRRFGLTGGSSTWKSDAPTIEVELDREFKITGWKSSSSNPDDDNLGVWAAADDVIRAWLYTVTARSELAAPIISIEP
jgi:hypothetical protein